MEPITSAAVGAIVAVAAEASKEAATHVAKSTWTRIKGLLGWTDDPPPAQLEARAAETLANRPELAEQVQTVVADYRRQIGGISVGSMGTIDLQNATVGQVKQAGIVNNPGTINM